MTDVASILACYRSGQISEAEMVGPYPVKAEFGCGRYADGSGSEITIGYSTTDPRWASYIVIDGYAVTFKAEHAEEVIEAIRYCATAVRAALGETQ